MLDQTRDWALAKWSQEIRAGCFLHGWCNWPLCAELKECPSVSSVVLAPCVMEQLGWGLQAQWVMCCGSTKTSHGAACHLSSLWCEKAGWEPGAVCFVLGVLKACDLFSGLTFSLLLVSRMQKSLSGISSYWLCELHKTCVGWCCAPQLLPGSGSSIAMWL